LKSHQLAVRIILNFLPREGLCKTFSCFRSSLLGLTKNFPFNSSKSFTPIFHFSMVALVADNQLQVTALCIKHMKCSFPFLWFVIVICLLLEVYHRDVTEGLNCKCSFEDFIIVDVKVNCQCNKSPEFDRREADEETVPVSVTIGFGLVFCMWLIVTCVVEFFFTTQVTTPLSKLAWYCAFVILITEILWSNCFGYNSGSRKWT